MTFRRTPAFITLLLVLTSCQTVTPGKPSAGAGMAPKAASKSAKPDAAAGAATTGAATAATAKPPTLLRPPTSQGARLTGQVRLDAHYATLHGGASRLVGPDGATMIGMDGASLVGADGATLVAGGRIVAAGAGNVVVPREVIGAEGPLLLGKDGGSLIGADAGSLIGADGGSLVGPDGASLVGPDGASYALAQQAPATAFGEQRPAAGMWVSVVDVRTGLTVPLGKDDAGADVHTVYTDAQGRFAVDIDPAIAAHVHVVARAPGRRDPRLVLNVITSTGAEERQIDETEAAVTGMLRVVAARRIAGYFGLTAGSAEAPALDELTAGVSTFLAPVKRELELAKAGPNGEARLEELGLLVADRIILETGYENLLLARDKNRLWHPEAPSLAGKPVVAELRGVARRLEERISARLGSEPDAATYFATRPFMIAANLGKAPADQYRIERPGDVFGILAREYLGSVRPLHDLKYAEAFDELGMSLLDRDRVTMVGPSLFGTLLTAIANSPSEDGVVEHLTRLVRDARLKLEAAPPRPTPAPGRTLPPVVEPPAEPVRQVETIAGKPVAPGTPPSTSTVNGPGESATLSLPVSLALDERREPPTLYVSEAGTNAIRRLTFDAARKATVSTVALSGAALRLPRGLQLDGQGNLYVTSSGSHTVHRIALAEDGASGVVTVIAGDGQAGYRDGPGAQARFNNPHGLAISPSGELLVADAEGHRIRRIALGQAGAPVTTLIGTGANAGVSGPLVPAPAIPGAETQGHPGAMPDTPVDVLFEPGGALLYLEGGSGTLRRVAEPFAASARAELVAGGRGITGFFDGYYHYSGFRTPTAMAFDPRGRIVIAGNFDNRIRVITPDGWVRTVAGGGLADGQPGGFADGPSDQARFNRPTDVAVAKDGTIYLTDSLNHLIRRIRP